MPGPSELLRALGVLGNGQAVVDDFMFWPFRDLCCFKYQHWIHDHKYVSIGNFLNLLNTLILYFNHTAQRTLLAL